MKSLSLAVFTLLLCTLFSCSKNNKDHTEEPDNTPLQLVKKISRYEFNGQFYTDSIAYSYDTAGHLITIVDLKTNLALRRFIYNGENLTALIDYLNGGQVDTLKNPIKLLDGGNTIFLDHTRPNPKGGIDTIQITYKWSGNQIPEIWTYLHLVNPEIRSFQRSLFSYNASGNEYEHTELLEDGSSHLQTRGLVYDQKKNYFSTIPRLNFIFGSWGFPGATRSVNNPVKAEFPGGRQVEYIWTYNDKDYPLTMQEKGKNYLALELKYNK
ncbi:MAG TPA: hypothetical protein VF008_07250 [Niastella sp.]